MIASTVVVSTPRFHRNAIEAGNPLPTRMETPDALRGHAALAVVFWHWQPFLPGRHVSNLRTPTTTFLMGI